MVKRKNVKKTIVKNKKISQSQNNQIIVKNKKISQSQNNQIMVKVDNSRKTIRKGESKPAQPRQQQQPIIINNQQPMMMNPYQQLQPANKNITIHTPPINVNNTIPPANHTSQPINITNAPPSSNFNVDEVINRFSKVSNDGFKSLQDQLNNINSGFHQASKNIADRLVNNRDTFAQNLSNTQKTPQAPPSKIIDINPNTELLKNTPSTSIIPLKNNNRGKDINETIAFLDKHFEDLDGMLNETPYKTSKLLSTPLTNRDSSNLVRKSLETPKKETSRVEKALKTYYEDQQNIKKEEEKAAEMLQNQILTSKAEEELVEIKKPDIEDKPPKDIQIDLKKGIYQNKGEEGVCPICSKQYDKKKSVHKHMVNHHTMPTNRKGVYEQDGKFYKTHSERDTIKKDGKTTYIFNDIDYEQLPKSDIYQMIEDRNSGSLEARNQKNRDRHKKADADVPELTEEDA